MGELLIHRRVPRVLVVDDNPDMAELMRELLASRGYDVATVRDADEAEVEVRRHAPDLILSDVVMPGRSGYELCQQLKDDPDTRLIPFILITGLSDREDKVKGIEAGADDFLNKPIFPAELLARVKSLLKLKEFTDELETAESVLCTLGRSVEARDPYTEGHCERLSRRAVALGRHIGLDDESLIALRRGGKTVAGVLYCPPAGEMFTAIAPRYDLLNHLLSLNIDRVWWNRAAGAFSHILSRSEARQTRFAGFSSVEAMVSSRTSRSLPLLHPQ